MAELILKNGIVVLLDDDDFQRLKHFNWLCYGKKSHPGYVYRNKWDPENDKNKSTYIHQDVLGHPGKGFVIDHINGNSLDNRKINLRICTQANNVKNRSIQKGNKSGYKGVFFQKELGKWRAQISVNSKRKHLGCFKEKIDAAIAYNEAAIKEYGEFAKLNIIEQCVVSMEY